VQRDYSTIKTNSLYYLFRQQVLLNPDKIALKYCSHSFNYTELDKLSRRIAHAILQQFPSLTEGSRIVIAMPRNPLAIASIIATQILNTTYVPFDPESPDERLDYISGDCEPVLLLTLRAYAGRQHACPEVYLDDIQYEDELPLCMLPQSQCDTAAYIMYTSGSTGKPKGVVIPQQGILRLVINAHPFQFSPSAIISQCGNIAFDASTFEIWGALLNGATLVLIPYETVIDSQALGQLLQQEHITDAFFTVALFNQLVAEEPDVFAGLKNVFTGGDALNPASVLAALTAEHPPEAIWNAYGPTENTVLTTLHRIQVADCQRSSIPIGCSIAGSQCYVLNDDLQPVPAGEEGELYTSGLGLAQGYLNKPDKTADAFLPNPFYQQECETSPGSASQKMYRTGDRVRLLADGTFDFLGRVDNQVKIRGFRLEPGEVEYRLCQLPGVDLAVVQAIVVDGQKQLAAWCQGSGSPQHLLSLFREQAPAYMVPVSLQMLDKLPITPNGKVDKRSLPPADVLSQDYDPPCSTTECWLAAQWQRMLRLENTPGRHGHFFNSGGHSLLVVKLRQAIAEYCGKEISLASLFRLPILHEMAAHIDQQEVQLADAAIPAVKPGSRIPLSEEQHRLWLICCREPQVAHYSIPLAFRITGRLAIPRLQSALRRLGERHHSLRLRIYEEQGKPWQEVVDAPVTLMTLPFQQESDIPAYLKSEVARPFRFGDEPLLRVTLCCVDERPAVLLFNIHHIISDGWSMGVFFQELATLYADDGEPLPLSCQYPDYCAWQQQQDFQPSVRWWQDMLAGTIPLALPVSGTAQQGSVMRSRLMSEQTLCLLQKTAIENHTGLFNMLYSGLALLLSRLCQQPDVVISGIWANRPRQDLSQQIGFFANTLLLRTQVEPGHALGLWLRDNHRMLTQGFEYGEAPLGQVLAATGIPATFSQHPLCAVLLVLQNTEGGDGKGLSLSECEITDYPLPEEQAKSDLLINVVPQNDGQLRIEATYRKGVWSDILMETLLDFYQSILLKMTEGAGQPLSELMALDQTMRQQQLAWNPVNRQEAISPLLPLFERWVRQTPDKIAVGCQSQTLTYAGLNQRAEMLAARLQARRGLLCGKRIAFAFERQLDTVVTMLAILKAGAVYVPFDPSHPDERLHYVLTDSEADCLIVDSRTAGRQTCCPEIILDSPDDSTTIFVPTSRMPSDEAYIMYTSGSTGEPKGVRVLQQGIVRLVVDAAPYQITADAVVAQAGNIAFDASTLEVWGALLNGARIEIIPYETVINSELLQQTLRERKVTDAWFTVALFNQLAADNPGAFSGIRNLLIGGDALTPSLVEAVLASDQPPGQIWNGYGPTENTTFTTLYPIQRKDCTGVSIPIGGSIAGTTCYVLDAHHQLLPPGAIGELYTSGIGLSGGYLNKAEKTAEAFIENPFFTETFPQAPVAELMYKTGDRVRWIRQGVLEFIGRGDNQVKIRGYRLEPGEVEHLLCQVEGVKQALVSVVEHQGQKQLAAWCVSRRSPASILTALGSLAPAYMVPAALQVIEKMPLTSNGKVDKSRLPPVDFGASLAGGTPPQGDVEQQLALIWQRLLKTERPCLREDNFFMIGGHSLLVIAMTDQIQSQMAKTVSVATIFQSRTLAELAANLEGKKQETDKDEEESILIAADSASADMHYLSATDRRFSEILLTGGTGSLGSIYWRSYKADCRKR
jgi:amino acid adenylation domain